MKIGDIIRRKDMPQFLFRIIGTNIICQSFWDVEPLNNYKGFGSWKSKKMIPKNDERWEIVPEKKERKE